MTIRNDILSALAARVGAQWGEAVEPDFNELPITAIAPGDDSATEDAYGVSTADMPVSVQRWESLGAIPAGAHSEAILGALIRETLSADRTLGGLCDAIQYTGGGADYPDADSDAVGAHATFIIRYRTVAGDPDTIPPL